MIEDLFSVQNNKAKSVQLEAPKFKGISVCEGDIQHIMSHIIMD